MASSLRANHYFLNGADQVELGNLSATLAGGKNCPFIHQRVKIGTGETRRALGNKLEVYILGKRLLAGVNLEDLQAIAAVRHIKRHSSVKAAGAEKRWIQDVWPITRCHHDHFLIGFKTVQFN